MSDKEKTPAVEPVVEFDEAGIARIEGSIQKATDYMKSVDDKYELLKDAQEGAADRIEKVEQRVSKKFTEFSDFLKSDLGASGAKDYTKLLGKWMKGGAAVSRGHEIPEDCKDPNIDWTPNNPNRLEKAVADFTTTTDATSGYLVPDILLSEIQVSRELYGNFIPLCRRLAVPAGVTALINRRSTNPSAFWRTTQGATMDEMEYVHAQSSVLPVLVGGYIKVANELWDLPGTGFQEDALDGMLTSITKHEETGMIQGDDDALGTKNDPPSDGFLTSTAGASDQTNLSAATLPILTNFIAESVVDYPILSNPNGTVMMLSPTKKWALASSAVGTAAANQVAWGDGISSPPANVQGFRIVEHPSMLVSATHWAALLRPGEDVFYANSGRLSVDFNPWNETAYTSNETWVRALTHSDWAFPFSTHISIADFD